MTHPILDAVASIDEALKSVADVNAVFMTTDEKATALRELTELSARLDAVRLSVLVEADDVAEATAAHDAAAWLAAATRTRPEDARADRALAHALDRRWTTVAKALRDGGATLAQAQIIAHALDTLDHEGLPAEVLTRAKETLVDRAADFGPRQLARLASHIVDVVAPEIADATEARRLAALEAQAHAATRVTARPIGHGSTRPSIVVPDASADRALTYLEAFTNPRKEQHERSGPTDDAVARLGTYPRRLGKAFCQFLEAVDPARLPIHSGDATTVIVTISLEDLRRDLATAEIIGASHVPGDHDGTDSAAGPQRITAAETRRLACMADIIPVVLGGPSEILDLGRTRRLFTPAQRKALILRDKTCRAEGCQIAGSWCEAHHWEPWGRGGNTDFDDGILLCHHHHQRVHDDSYTADRLANGDVLFHRRT